MPGPGPRGPCETYRAPCSRFEDSRISARNPRKPGKSRRARGTRTRQPRTRSTRDGLSCGEIASAAGGTRPSILDPRRLLNEIRRTGLDSRAAQRPRARQPITSSTRDGLCLSNRDANTRPGARAARAAARRPLHFVCPGGAKIRSNRIPARADRSAGAARGTGSRDPIRRPRSLKIRSRCPAARAGTGIRVPGPRDIGSFC